MLKREDFKGAYEAAYNIEATSKEYQLLQHERNVHSNINFEETNNVDKKLIIVSIVEIVIVIAAGAYQYYSLQNYLTTKQYI